MEWQRREVRAKKEVTELEATRARIQTYSLTNSWNGRWSEVQRWATTWNAPHLVKPSILEARGMSQPDTWVWSVAWCWALGGLLAGILAFTPVAAWASTCCHPPVAERVPGALAGEGA